MATYYISVSGSDASNGLGPDASHATNKPWLTLAKALHAGSVVVPGDTIYIGPGNYYSSAVTPIAGLTSVANPTALRGDPTNAQGFKDGSGVRLAPALVWITTRTSTGPEEELTSATSLLTLSTNANHGFQFYHLCLEAGRAQVVLPSSATSTDLLFEDCRMMCASIVVYTVATLFNAATNWTFRRCLMVGSNFVFNAGATVAAGTADADTNIQFEHCLLFGGFQLQMTAAAGNKAGGLDVNFCTIFLGRNQSAMTSVAGRVSTVTPCTMTGCLLVGGFNLFSTGTTGEIIDGGYNRTVLTAAASTNTTQAGTTKQNVMPNLVWPDLLKWGLAMPRWDVFGWGPGSVAAQYSSGATNAQPDFRGRTVRPWGAGPSIGYSEVVEIAKDTGSAITGGGANSLKITGGGEVSFFIPVDAAATTVGVRTKSTTYGGASYPQLVVVANPDLGVTQQTVTAAAATEETITTGSFTPTAKGVVEVRLISRSTTVTSSTYFDLLAA